MSLLLLVLSAHAAEGMWLPEQAPAVAAERPGVELDPAALGDPLGDPLGAIVTLGGCSASFVSPDGLVVTNHHCVEGYLQYLSDGEHNLHRDGFVAPTRADERWVGPTAKLRVVEAMTDVTAEMLRGVGPRTSDRDRTAKLEANEKRLVAACEAVPDRRCDVAGYFGGSTYRLIRTFEIEDVRLVWAPPMSVGQFGGEVDNWMWPRHGGDAAFLRAYVAPDGTAAPHADANVPFRPPHHLRLGDGVHAGDAVMVAGFPGSTQRHELASQLRWRAGTLLPERVATYEDALAVIRRHMASSPEAAARLGALETGYANRLKKSEGLLAGLAGHDLVGAKEADERAVLAWADAHGRGPELRQAYDQLQALAATEQAQAERTRALRDLLGASSLLQIAHDALRQADEARRPDAAREPGFQDRDLDRRRARYERLQQSLWLPAERELVARALHRYADAPPAQHVPTVDAWLDGYRGDVDAAVAALYDAPSLATAEARLALLDRDAKALRASSDPFLRLATAVEAFLADEREAAKARGGAWQRLGSRWMLAKRAAAEAAGRPLSDDANGTLRLSFATVQGYRPRDGLLATPFTTVDGIPPKAGPFPFDIPRAVLDRIPEASSSRWADPELGTVPVDFLSDLDTTGGNSGSAVLDGRGRLVGLLFDGNWESIASDFAYLEDVNRSISVDLRYVRWLLEGDEGGRRVLAELDGTVR